VTAGYKPGDFDLIAITASPCGGCRQWHVEFGVERVVYENSDGDLVEHAPTELLPDTFVL
jgi:cytidine deaminase